MMPPPRFLPALAKLRPCRRERRLFDDIHLLPSNDCEFPLSQTTPQALKLGSAPLQLKLSPAVTGTVARKL